MRIKGEATLYVRNSNNSSDLPVAPDDCTNPKVGKKVFGYSYLFDHAQNTQAPGARWKIESGFKKIKQEIGAGSSQMRNEQSVKNHLNYCMMTL